ncbi:MAG: cell wall hydrolase [Eubacteriales bacterium]|nr:cell wall hydrolase [Eubacteriales bacterium]
MNNRKIFVTAGLVLSLTGAMAAPAFAEENKALTAESVTDVIAQNAETAKNSAEAGKSLYKAEDWSRKAAPDTWDYVNIRSDASITSDVKGILLLGDICTVKGEKNGWTEVESGDVKGYIRSDLLLKGEDAWKEFTTAHGNAYVVEAPELNIRMDGSMDGEIVGAYDEGTEVTVLGEENGWYKVSYYEVTGYVSGDYLKPADSVYTAMTYQEYLDTLDSAGDSVVAVDNSGIDIEAGDFTDFSYADYAESTEEYSSDTENTYADDASVYEETEETVSYEESAAGDESYTENSADEVSYEENTNTEEAADDSASGENSENVSVSSSELDLLAAIIHCEAGGESREGKVAVGACIMNRIASASFPNTITDVVYQAGQFEPAMTGGLQAVLASGADADCYEAAQAALNGENPIGGLLYFHAGSGSGLTIGNQTFY